jgi:hypothetical protein
MLDFPTSPPIGTVYDDPITGTSWVWDGNKWTAAGGRSQGVTGGEETFIGLDPPPSPVPGDLWFDSVSGIMFVWYTDLDSSQWVGLH